jgi:hypothetical protein
VVRLAARNQEWIDACAPVSAGVLCDLLRATGAAVDSWGASADLRALAEGVSWAGVDQAPVWLCLAREYTERWVHQQQLRDALDRPGLDDETHLGAVVDTFKWAIPIALTDTTGLLRVELTGAAARSWLVDRAGFHASGVADATVAIAADAFWRQCTTPRNQASGNGSIIDAFARTRAIIV